MNRVHRLEQSQLIRRPPAEVFAFFSDAANLEKITPPVLRFSITTPPPVRIGEGALIDFRLKLHGIPFPWQSRIESFQPDRQFVDTQTRGPYRRWRHLHRFEAQDGGTRMIDQVQYELPWGLLGSLAHRLFVRRDLENVFTYRRRRIAELLETDGCA